jgi:acyl-CoA dehydrogenase
MDFDFSPEQEQFREQIRRLLTKANGLTEGRAILNGHAESYSKAIWQGLAGMGIQALAIPEEHAGSGLGVLELCVAAEEIGRVLAPVPFLSSIGVCAEAVRLFGSAAQQAKWLPGLADGSIIGTWAFADDSREAGPESKTRLKAKQIWGTKAPVLDGLVAQIMVVTAADESGAPTLVLCDLSHPRVERKLVKTVDPTRPAAQIKFVAANAEPLPGGSGDAWQKLKDRAALLLAFEQLGSAEAALAMACEYAQDRTAFGRRIGSFQAIKHRLADMLIKIRIARCHCYYGAWAISTEAEEASLAAAGARCSATEAFDFAAQENIQIHGGIGVTWEANCQLFYRRARLYALVLGSRFEWQDRLVTALEAYSRSH